MDERDRRVAFALCVCAFALGGMLCAEKDTGHIVMGKYFANGRPVLGAPRCPVHVLFLWVTFLVCVGDPALTMGFDITDQGGLPVVELGLEFDECRQVGIDCWDASIIRMGVVVLDGEIGCREAALETTCALDGA